MNTGENIQIIYIWHHVSQWTQNIPTLDFSYRIIYDP